MRMINDEADAREIVVVTFERAFFSLRKYNNQYQFSTWLYKILINQVYSYWNKKRAKPIFLERDIENKEDGPAEILEKKEFWEHVNQALLKIPLEQRSTFVLSVFNHLSVDEIAKVHDCSRGTVCWRLLEARKKMAKILSRYEGSSL